MIHPFKAEGLELFDARIKENQIKSCPSASPLLFAAGPAMCNHERSEARRAERRVSGVT
ncbi:MAG: hypothetical protein AAF598_04390 [Bacteroidota bacterium]